MCKASNSSNDDDGNGKIFSCLIIAPLSAKQKLMVHIRQYNDLFERLERKQRFASKNTFQLHIRNLDESFFSALPWQRAKKKLSLLKFPKSS